jgi:hypothetical protein
MHIFIDANVFLSFYEASADALLELSKIEAVINAGKASLWLPDQVKREFWKNREGSIAAALREFEKSAGLGPVPRLVRENEEFQQLTELAGAAEKRKAEIIAHIREEVAKEETAAARSSGGSLLWRKRSTRQEKSSRKLMSAHFGVLRQGSRMRLETGWCGLPF